MVGPLRLSGPFLAGYRGLFEHVPHVARAELGPLYRDADLLAFPTLGDGFGLVIQEAMCSGIPVLTTPCGGGPECLDDGVEGWLVPPADVDALVERLRWAAANRDRLAEMGRSARRRAERFDERAAEAALLEGIDRALATTAPSGALEG
jgi:glycosyltransferase involved in cell wall biosynthesis